MVVLRLGSFSEAARALAAETGRSHSRQGVYKMWQRRAVNGFPEQHEYEINGRVKSFFDIGEVLAWDVTNRTHKPKTVD